MHYYLICAIVALNMRMSDGTNKRFYQATINDPKFQEFLKIMGNRFSIERHRKDLSQEDLPGFSSGLLGAIERGYRPSTLRVLYLLAEALGCDLEVVLIPKRKSI